LEQLWLWQNLLPHAKSTTSKLKKEQKLARLLQTITQNQENRVARFLMVATWVSFQICQLNKLFSMQEAEFIYPVPL
jgi:hypothetical protein